MRDQRNRPRASQIRYSAATSTGRGRARRWRPALAAAALFFALLVVLALVDELPVVLLAGYGLFSLVAFFMYRADKSAAEQRRWRTPESTLHTVALVGGWPGALVARHAFRHKTTKQPFRTVFWLTVMVNCAALAWWVAEAPVVLP